MINEPSGKIPVVEITNDGANFIESTSNDRPSIIIGLVANMFVRMMSFKNIGSCETGHTHSFDHLTLLASGSLRVTANNKSTDYKAPMMIYIDAETKHELTALEPNTTAFCIHGLRDLDISEELISPDMLPEGVVEKWEEQKRLSKMVLGDTK